MSTMTENEVLAGSTSQDGSVKEPVQAYDAKHGTYQPPHTQGQVTLPTQPASPVNPFGALRGVK